MPNALQKWNELISALWQLGPHFSFWKAGVGGEDIMDASVRNIQSSRDLTATVLNVTAPSAASLF